MSSKECNIIQKIITEGQMKNLFAFAMALVLCLGSISNAQTPAKTGNKPMRKMETLRLKEDQKTKMNDLRAAHQTKMVDLKAELQKNRIEKEKIISSGNLDVKALRHLTEESNRIEGEIRLAQFEHWVAVYNLLDKDQQKIFLKNKPGKPFPGEGMERKGKMNRRGEMGFSPKCKEFCEENGPCIGNEPDMQERNTEGPDMMGK